MLHPPILGEQAGLAGERRALLADFETIQVNQ